MRQAQEIQLTIEERLRLQWFVGRKSVSSKVVERAEIILLAEKGMSNIEIAKQLNITRQKVARWRQRFLEHRLDGIEKDATRPGRKAELPDDIVSRIIETTLKRKPSEGDVWTQKSVAEVCGVSSSSVGRIWKKYGISPKIKDADTALD